MGNTARPPAEKLTQLQKVNPDFIVFWNGTSSTKHLLPANTDQSLALQA